MHQKIDSDELTVSIYRAWDGSQWLVFVGDGHGEWIAAEHPAEIRQ